MIIKHGTEEYISYYVGDKQSKIILTVPHGGYLVPSSIPNRNKHTKAENVSINICVENDDFTKELAVLLREELQNITGFLPHMIVCNLHRKKLDVNRGLFEATLNEHEAVIAYKEFHEFINIAKNDIGKGLLLDLHGQSHPEEWVELGYMISRKDLCSNNLQYEHSSVKALAIRSQYQFEDIVRGPVSLGGFLQKEGIKCIPSPKHMSSPIHYFHGGYITGNHGSMKNGGVDAIQVETPICYRKKRDRRLYVTCLANALKKFVEMHY